MKSISYMFDGAIKKGALIGGVLGAAALGIPASRIAKHVLDEPDSSLMKDIVGAGSDANRVLKNLTPSEKTTGKIAGIGGASGVGAGTGATIGAGIGALSNIGKKKKKRY